MALPGLIVGGQALQQDENSRFTNRHLAQIIAERAAMLERDRLHNDWLNRGRAAGAGQLFGPGAAPQTAPVAAPFAGPMAPPTGMAPGGLSVTEAMGAMGQPPAPGQASVPMQPGPPPMGALGGIGAPDMPPGAPQGAVPVDPSLAAGPSEPQAAPQPAGWQPSPAAGLELGGTGAAATAAESAAGLEPPAPPSVPKGMTTLALISGLQKRTDLSPEDKLAAVEYLHPIVKAQEQEALTAFKQENEILRVGIAAMRAESDRLRAQTGATVGGARVTRMQQGAAVDVAAEARKREELDARLSGRLSRASASVAAGGAEPEALTEGGQAVAAELSRAGLPIPGGWGKAGIARGNAILNRMALDQEGGAGSGSIASGRGQYKADQASYQQRQKQVDALEAASKKIEKDIVTMTSVMDKGVAGSVTLVNEPMNVLRRKFSDPELTKYALAVKQVGVEYERMINGGLLSVAQLHEGAREDAAKIINESMTPEQVKGVIPIMLQEIANQRNAHHEQLDEIKARMKGAAGRPATGTVAPDGTRINVTPGQTPVGREAMQRDIELKNKVQAAGQRYEPDKFDYRIGPAGEIQRKPK